MKLVTSYLNPDLDGVACAIVYSIYLSDDTALPRFAGRLNTETEGVLRRLRVAGSFLVDVRDSTPIDEVVLVDCHHPAQLPHIADLRKVVLIIDHHPDGDAAAFPNAVVRNEPVGAAATLVAERVAERRREARALRPEHAALLACAIASNTLDFAAPSTTDRDCSAFERLVVLARPLISVTMLQEDMRGWRRDFLTMSTIAAVNQDVKIIQSRFGPIAVSQLEADGASALHGRPDIREAVDKLARRGGVVGSLVSLVDTAARTTTLVSGDVRIRESLRKLGPEVVDEVTLRLHLVALRKTHIIPALMSD